MLSDVLVTPHFHVSEFTCHNGASYPVDRCDEEDPRKRPWIETRLRPLCEVLEIIRDEMGGEPIHVNSGFRTMAYDQRLYDASAHDGSVATASGSQHPRGRAADIVWSGPADDLHATILALWGEGKLSMLGGLGKYPGRFVHVDVRPHPQLVLARWQGSRLSNVV